MPSERREGAFGAWERLQEAVKELVWGDNLRIMKSAKFERVLAAADQIA